MKQFNPNKDYKCKDCKNPYKKTFALQSRCVTCAVEKGKQNARRSQQKEYDRQQRQQREEWREKKNKMREEIGQKKDPTSIPSLQRKINLLVRLIDKGHRCISSDKQYKNYDAGHFHTVGARPWIRFHLLNIWAQSKVENGQFEGNRDGYRKGIIGLYGHEVMNELDALEWQYQDINLMKHEIKDAMSRVDDCISEINKKHKRTGDLTISERLEYRVKFNKYIGIYK